MVSRFRALVAPFVLALAGFASVALAQQLPVPLAPAPKPPAETPWLFKGSDVPQDPAWRFGVLPNGVRYAVRRNGVPPGQVSIRVRIDAGSLMEQDKERGFAHLIEHLSFRGSEHVPDGESKRIWQRLGATFGSDTNASTTFTQTVYKLDLPDASQAGLDESMKILAGMMEHPTLTQAALDAERPVVLAEQRERPGPQVRFNDAMLNLVFAGQPIASRNPIGTVETLTGATAASVQAFHDRWYRPERAVVILVGDQPPDVLEAMVVKHFSDWKGVGPATPTPDFGKPIAGGPSAVSFVEPALPPAILFAVARPWTVFQDTIIFNQKRMIDMVAIRLIDRRLETRARAGGSFIVADADLQDVSRSANVTTVTIRPTGDNWEAALRDVRAVVADAMATPPTQKEIDRELAEIDAGMRNSVATAPVEAGATLADNMVQAVDINETTTSAEGSYSIFKQAVDKKMFTPASVQEATKRVFQGTVSRALVATRTPDAEAVAKLTAALKADVSGAVAKRRAMRNVTFAQFPSLGSPGKIVSRSVLLAEPKIELVKFANGVNLQLFETTSEHNRVYVRVRFGGGLNALPSDHRTPAWAGEMALMAGGIGKFGQEELDALTGNRQISMDFGIDEDAFVLAGQTDPNDLPDQLRLFATKLAYPRWDPHPVNRARAVMLAGYDTIASSPDGVLSRDLENLLHSGDPRWGMPSRQEIEALTPEAFKALWQPLLASGPIEVQVFGDIKTDAAIDAVARTFGALAPRKALERAAPPVAFPQHVAQPVVRTHSGQPDQAAAVIGWPTGGGSAGAREARKLDVLAAIFRDRLIDQLRSQAGVSYSPNVSSDWPLGMPSGGKILALGMVPPDKADFFFTLARQIAADLAARPIDRDELRRSLLPLAQLVIRSSTGSPFWMRQTAGGSTDAARIDATRMLAQDLGTTSPQEIQALAQKYLRPDKDWTMVVLPEQKVAKANAPAGTGAN